MCRRGLRARQRHCCREIRYRPPSLLLLQGGAAGGERGKLLGAVARRRQWGAGVKRGEGLGIRRLLAAALLAAAGLERACDAVDVLGRTRSTLTVRRQGACFWPRGQGGQVLGRTC